jgi:voltage-gated potassium channel
MFSGSRQELRALTTFVGSLVGVVVLGTVGYRLIEGWSLFDCLYMTVMTIFTVGYREVHPLSTAGTAFTMVLIVVGVGAILYGLGRMAQFVVGEQLTGVFRRRVVKRQVDKLEGHFIICGYGRVGEAVARQFAAHAAKFVVIDHDPDSVARAEAEGFLTVRGDATADEILELAGVRRAKGLVAAVGSDAGNIYVTLSARVLNPALLIVARAGTDDTASKLERAGADHVVSPYGIGGKRMATLMLKPLVSDYLEIVTGGGELEFRVEEFALQKDSPAVGQSIEDLAVRRKTGATILAVRRADTGLFDTNPSPDTRLHPGDMIIAIGTPVEIARLEELLRSGEGR